MRKGKLVVIFLITSAFCNAQDSLPKLNIQEERKIYPILFQQTASEYRALCYQAFNIAELRINKIKKKRFRKEKLAIITDLDETILDNSYQEAQLIKDNKEYKEINSPTFEKKDRKSTRLNSSHPRLSRMPSSA